MKSEELLKRTDLVGGWIEIHQGFDLQGGPIAKFELVNNKVCFTSPWIAKHTTDEYWEKIEGNELQMTERSFSFYPSQMNPKILLFNMLHLGNGTIYPKGERKIDTNKIFGLPKAWERLLALYPNLELKTDAALHIIFEKSWSYMVQELSRLPGDSKIEDLLKRLRTENSREEFLQDYIKAVKGEDASQLVY